MVLKQDLELQNVIAFTRDEKIWLPAKVDVLFSMGFLRRVCTLVTPKPISAFSSLSTKAGNDGFWDVRAFMYSTWLHLPSCNMQEESNACSGQSPYLLPYLN